MFGVEWLGRMPEERWWSSPTWPKAISNFFVHNLKQNSCQFVLCNHALFYKLNVYFFCRIDAHGHQNRCRPSSTPTNTFHEDRTPSPFLSLTALFLFCAPQSCTQIAHASRPRRRSQRSSRRRAPPIMIRPTTPHSLTKTSIAGRRRGVEEEVMMDSYW